MALLENTVIKSLRVRIDRLGLPEEIYHRIKWFSKRRSLRAGQERGRASQGLAGWWAGQQGGREARTCRGWAGSQGVREDGEKPQSPACWPRPEHSTALGALSQLLWYTSWGAWSHSHSLRPPGATLQRPEEMWCFRGDAVSSEEMLCRDIPHAEPMRAWWGFLGVAGSRVKLDHGCDVVADSWCNVRVKGVNPA